MFDARQKCSGSGFNGAGCFGREAPGASARVTPCSAPANHMMGLSAGAKPNSPRGYGRDLSRQGDPCHGRGFPHRVTVAMGEDSPELGIR